jgi:hypothetical protein
VRRLLWRHVSAGARHFTSGGCNEHGVAGTCSEPRKTCLFTAYTLEGALAEYDKVVAAHPPYRHRPRDLVTVFVDVEPVLDLTDSTLQASYRMTDARMRGADYRACRHVVRRAILLDGYRAIRAPSAAAGSRRAASRGT